MASKNKNSLYMDELRTEDVIYLSRIVNGNDPESALQLLYESCGWTPASQWQKPVTEYGDNLPEWKSHVVRSMTNIGQFEIDDESFERAGRYTNAVLALMFKAMTVNASRYTGLVLEGYSYQGSSRDGLKVISPDEFDAMLTFHIKGLRCMDKKIEKNGQEVSGFCYIRVAEAFTAEQLEEEYPELYRCGIFEMKADSVFISSRKLHQCIFESIVDKSIQDFENISKASHLHGKNLPTIKRKMNPPSINIVLQVSNRGGAIHPEKIDIDIVPALLLYTEYERSDEGQSVPFPVYAICKWTESESSKAFDFADSESIWHISRVSYENYIFDVARQDHRQRCVMMAIRLLKTYFTKARGKEEHTPQVVSLLKSYHIKQIGLYTLLHLCYKKPDIVLHGTEDSVRYIFTFMDNALKVQHLPHFFHSHSEIKLIFPNYPTNPAALSYDLFHDIDAEALHQAQISWNDRVATDFLFQSGLSPDLDTLIKSCSFRASLLADKCF